LHLTPSHVEEEVRGSVSAASAVATPSLESKLAMLDRLEQLEKEQEERMRKGQDDFNGEEDEVEITTHVSKLGLVKGMHLPDAIVVPDLFEDSD
jgi:hypothetical protein